MKWMTWFVVAVLVGACGDSGSGAPRSAQQACDELCGWPTECYAQLGVSAPDMNCVAACEEQADAVGVACLSAIVDTFNCLGTCNFEELSEDQVRACQGNAEAIADACD